MSIIEDLRTYILTYSQLKAGAAVLIETLGKEPTQYAILPLAGGRILERYINGATLREYPFAIQSMEYTSADLERLENNGFYEALADWFETQTEAGVLPTLDAGKTAEAIEASGWGFILEQGESGSGIYQITGRLIYQQEP